jgi:hypothetical protein
VRTLPREQEKKMEGGGREREDFFAIAARSRSAVADRDSPRQADDNLRDGNGSFKRSNRRDQRDGTGLLQRGQRENEGDMMYDEYMHIVI